MKKFMTITLVIVATLLVGMAISFVANFMHHDEIVDQITEVEETINDVETKVNLTKNIWIEESEEL